jgi:hypothetical protein
MPCAEHSTRECPYSQTIAVSASKIDLLVPTIEKMDAKLDTMLEELAFSRGRESSLKGAIDTFHDRVKENEKAVKESLTEAQSYTREREKNIREALLEAEARVAGRQIGPTGGFLSGVLAAGILIGAGILSIFKPFGVLNLFK